MAASQMNIYFLTPLHYPFASFMYFLPLFDLPNIVPINSWKSSLLNTILYVYCVYELDLNAFENFILFILITP